jgi:ACS family pantothenate transporter-like MFS transporter
MFFGFLQAAAYTNLHNVQGLAGWRWLLIIDAIITLPIAVAGFFFLPDMPLQGNAPWWLSKEVRQLLDQELMMQEFQLAADRVSNHGKGGREDWSKAKVKRLFSSWHIYVLRACNVITPADNLALLYVIWNNGIIQSPMSYWQKSFNEEPAPVPGVSYSVSEINQRKSIRTTLC